MMDTMKIKTNFQALIFKKKMNKKAWESTIVWIAGFFIIVFLLGIYLFIVAGIAGEKFFSEGSTVKTSSSSYNDRGLLESFLSFVNENGGLVNQNPVRFQELANKFLDENVMKETYSIDVEKGKVKRAWIRIYGVDEIVKQYSYEDNYRQYELTRGTEKVNTFPCDPENYMNDIFVVIEGSKKIALCLEYQK